MSENRAALLRKISKLSSDIGFLNFDARNTGQNYGYASAAGVIRTINKKMAELGLALTTEPEMMHFSIQQDPAKNRLVSYAVVKVTLRVFDTETGEFVASAGIGSGVDYGDKAQYKANTGAYKYALAHLLCLAWGAEDPEADPEADNIGKPAKGKDIISKIKACKTTAQLEALKEEVRLAGTEAIEAFKAHPKYVAPGGS